jgi:hypothetical protein
MEHTLVSPATGDEYVGHVPVGQLTGTGTFRCAKNGAVYTGEYEGNRFHGIGVLTGADGNGYRGQFEDGKMEGAGVLTLANGNVYHGQFKGGETEGDGVLVLANGNVYRGQFKRGEKAGDGVLVFANGNVYRGQWKGGKEEGDGVLTWADGNVYRGQWKGGKMEGEGYTWQAGLVFGILAVLVDSGREAFGRWIGGKKISSVPFDAAIPAHAAVLCAANEAEARRVGMPHPRRRDRRTSCVVQTQANAAEARAEAAVFFGLL